MFEKENEKDLVCETVVWSLADRVRNLVEKNDPVCQTVIWSLNIKCSVFVFCSRSVIKFWM